MNCTPETNNIGVRKTDPLSLKSLRILSFNVRRNWKDSVASLEIWAEKADIILFQEPAWNKVQIQPSTLNKKGDMAFGPPIHPSWISLTENFDPTNEGLRPRVLTYVNRRFVQFKPQIRTDIIKHRDVSIVTLRVKKQREEIPRVFNIMNVYNDGKLNMAVRLLEENLSKFPCISVCGGDFNIQDSMWDDGLDPCRAHSSWFMRLKDVMNNLEITYGYPSNQGVPTHIPDCPEQRWSVIDLLFSTSSILGLHDTSIKILNDADCRLSSDHNPILMTIPFAEEEMKAGKEKIDEWSGEEDEYVEEVVRRIDDLIKAVEEINTKEMLSGVMEGVGVILDNAWKKYSYTGKPSRWGRTGGTKNVQRSSKTLK
jgi:hypothetical protein